MESHTQKFLPTYNFDEALKLPVEERFRLCIERIRDSHSQQGYAQLVMLPPIPPVGASPQELKLSQEQIGAPLPAEYAAFLSQWRYLDLDAGLNIWGLEYANSSLGSPYVSEEHRPPYKYLVFGDYWNYADGDQLMFDLSTPEAPVVVYLHEHGLIEYFAPSFSLALWRMVDERL